MVNFCAGLPFSPLLPRSWHRLCSLCQAQLFSRRCVLQDLRSATLPGTEENRDGQSSPYSPRSRVRFQKQLCSFCENVSDYSTFFRSHCVLLAADKRPLRETTNGHTAPPHLASQAGTQRSPFCCCFCASSLQSLFQRNTVWSHLLMTLKLFYLWRKGFTMTTIMLQSYINLWMSGTDGTRICVRYPV